MYGIKAVYENDYSNFPWSFNLLSNNETFPLVYGLYGGRGGDITYNLGQLVKFTGMLSHMGEIHASC